MSKEDEKWKNLVIFYVWATDEEIEQSAPLVVVVIMVLAIIVLIGCCVTRKPGIPSATATTSITSNHTNHVNAVTLEKKDE